jgi:hypothetical protein
MTYKYIHLLTLDFLFTNCSILYRFCSQTALSCIVSVHKVLYPVSFPML